MIPQINDANWYVREGYVDFRVLKPWERGWNFQCPLPLVVNATITNHSILGILINDGSSHDLVYLAILMKLGLYGRDSKSRGGIILLIFNDYLTRPCKVVYLLVSFGEGKNMRTVNMHFLIVPSDSIYNNILWRSFLETLRDVASTYHMEMKYHNDSDKPIFVITDLYETLILHETLLENPLATFVVYEKRKRIQESNQCSRFQHTRGRSPKR